MENLRHHQSTSSEETQSVAWALSANLLSDNPNRAVVFIFISWATGRLKTSFQFSDDLLATSTLPVLKPS
ncbi:hypothetical protein [Neisseria sp. HMSC065D04]|uniref:hypothetical protein n=1 Tax=Neisseria sp. HMSC065D04 TaxID=1739542 RepID=UPI00114CAF7F|nr:hypothetical protein [Neisseria sp. HMSC065D04]